MTLRLTSPDDPAVTIDGTDYKIYTENFPPPGGGGGLIGVQRFLSSGTYTSSENAKTLVIEVQGGGGGGGSATSLLGSCRFCSGGGSGTYVMAMMTLTEPLTVSVSVSASMQADTSGSSSSFGSYITAYGGGAGKMVTITDIPYVQQASTTSNQASSGYVVSALTQIKSIQGGRGGPFFALSGTSVLGGKGDDSPFGKGGAGGYISVWGGGGTGVAGDRGAGGGGGVSAAGTSGSNYSGGNGGAGCVIVWEYA